MSHVAGDATPLSFEITSPEAVEPAVAKVESSFNNDNPQISEEEIPSDADEETRLKYLTTGTRNQDDLERDIGRQADQMLAQQADERDKRRMEKADAEAKRTLAIIQKLKNRLALPMVDTQRRKLRVEIEVLQKKVEAIDNELDTIQKRINDRHAAPDESEAGQIGSSGPLPNESRRDFLIRTGKITPFSKLAQNQPATGTLEEAMQDIEMEEMVIEAGSGPISHQNLMKPGFESTKTSATINSPEPPRKKRRLTPAAASDDSREASPASEPPSAGSDDAYTPNMSDRKLAALGDSESDIASIQDETDEGRPRNRKRKTTGQSAKKLTEPAPAISEEEEDLAGIDDGNERVYQNRVRTWSQRRLQARRQATGTLKESPEEDNIEDEGHKPHPTVADTELDGGFRIPGDIYPALFDYQKIGVQWLWELYSQNVGGIVGDEMGLGKTIQAISFVAGLHYSNILTKPVIVVCPATVMKQWVNEFHRWWPALRVSILHSSGSGMLDTRREDRMELEMESRNHGYSNRTFTSAGKAAKKIVEKARRDGHVLITTYSGLQTYSEFLVPIDWETAILDEGHKIRNPNAAITIHCKELRTPSRIILSGTPMQNNLTELWSLFDFVFPMRLGTLVSFRNQFEFPIKRGGYANASNLEFETAMQCAETLKDAISPYLLQRFKIDVATDLPQKKEQVLFCKLTRQQRQAYEGFLYSSDMKAITDGKRQMLYGIDFLRKICNHPDLTEHKTLSKQPDYDYGAPNKSGKMQVVKELLTLWVKGGHKTLLFAQHRIMLDILQKYLSRLEGINYRRMDGETPIKDRQSLVDEFNRDPDLHVFLLTTKVGGLGVNLTGANRVIIYDPDWNPSTDIQARERSWRLGQKREVEIYRLMSAGTIEEKIYHRQIFKQFLTNKVLKDPKQRQTFQMSDLHDLFTLGSDSIDGATETGNMFRGAEVQLENGPKIELNTGSIKPTDMTAPADLAAVRGIAHAELFREPSPLSNDTASKTGNGTEDASDSHLMTSIFAKSGVHSVLEHDSIINSSSGGRKRKVQADPAFIKREAKKQAELAARELKKSMEAARQAPIGVPTWTGLYGEAGRPKQHPQPSSSRGGLSSSRGGASTRGGPSSASIMNNLAVRQGRAPQPSPNNNNTNITTTSTPTTFRGRQMLVMLRDFLLTHGGTVPTRMLVDHFDHYCRAVPGRSDEFREMLKVVARLEKTGGGGGRGVSAGNGRGKWVLREEWREKGS